MSILSISFFLLFLLLVLRGYDAIAVLLRSFLLLLLWSSLYFLPLLLLLSRLLLRDACR
jgi:hypothetical protein